MKALVWVITAIGAYLISGLNPAIILSKAIYHKDIREEGSKNAGFTNFKRVFGNKYAWWVFFLDIFKGVVVAITTGYVFKYYVGNGQLGVAYAGVFAMLGHAYPLWYGFKGGKGFLVCLSTLIILNPVVGAVAFAVMTVLVLVTKYMSLATMCAMLTGIAGLLIYRTDTVTVLLYSACVFFMISRHSQNIKRLINGTESRFTLGHSGETKR